MNVKERITVRGQGGARKACQNKEMQLPLKMNDLGKTDEVKKKAWKGGKVTFGEGASVVVMERREKTRRRSASVRRARWR